MQICSLFISLSRNHKFVFARKMFIIFLPTFAISEPRSFKYLILFGKRESGASVREPATGDERASRAENTGVGGRSCLARGSRWMSPRRHKDPTPGVNSTGPALIPHVKQHYTYRRNELL